MKKEYLDSYLDYNRILRSWFIAFGIGGPVILLTNDTLYADFLRLDEKGCIAILFFGGLFIQVFIAWINKMANWYKYSRDDGRRFEIASWLLRQFWIDITADILSICAFGLAIYLLFQGLVGLNKVIV